MVFRGNRRLERNKVIAIRVLKGELLKDVSEDSFICLERTSQIVYEMLNMAGVEYEGRCRSFSAKLTKEAIVKIEGLK